MKTYLTTSSTLIGAAILVIFSATDSIGESDSRDSIALYADTSRDANGNTKVTCNIVNESNHILGWGTLKFTNIGFQFKLFDSAGEILPQEEEWAENHAQEGTQSYEHPRGVTGSAMNPSDKIGFEFDLEDAYGKRAAEGRRLIVYWNGAQLWEDVEHEVPAGIDGKGNPVKAHKAKVKFPPDWKLTATVPIPQQAGNETISPPSGRPSDKVAPEKSPSSLPSGPADASLPPASTQGTKETDKPVPSPNPWWWAPLAIPALLLAWLGLRTHKQR